MYQSIPREVKEILKRNKAENQRPVLSYRHESWFLEDEWPLQPPDLNPGKNKTKGGSGYASRTQILGSAKTCRYISCNFLKMVLFDMVVPLKYNIR